MIEHFPKGGETCDAGLEFARRPNMKHTEKKFLLVLPGSGIMAGSGVSNSGNIVVIIITWEISLTETAFPCKTCNAGSGWKVSE